MPIDLAPGVYFERPHPRPVQPLRRTDVAGFVGIAERGPLHQPQRLTNWRQFQQVFGGFLPQAHLAYAVHAFFENGGRTCWVVRVADQATARVARGTLPAAVDPSLEPSPAPVAYQVEAIHPGTWGNQVAIALQSASLARTQHVAIATLPPTQLAVQSLVGLEPGSRVQLSQLVDDQPRQVIAGVQRVDPIQRLLWLDRSLTEAGLQPTQADAAPISVVSQEFTLLVSQANQGVERFADLSSHPDHSRYAPRWVNSESRLIRLHQEDAAMVPVTPWQVGLSGGLNGLRTLDVYDYVGSPQGDRWGLATLAEIDEVALLAIPDLVLHADLPIALARAPRRAVPPCALDTPLARVTLQGSVVDAETDQPLPAVQIEVDDGLRSQSTTTDASGQFTLSDLLPGALDLVLRGDRYEERIYTITPAAQPPAQTLAPIALTPLDLPPRLSELDLVYGQMALIRQCEQQRDRFALLDPPLSPSGTPLDLEQLQTWRLQFDTAFAALYYPWLGMPDPLQPTRPQPRMVPPSGHVAGLYAVTDLAVGVFRAPANRALALVQDLTPALDDTQQAGLNPLGINVIRAYPGRGIRVNGARTLSRDTAWRFVNVRRFVSALEEVIQDQLQWAVFEPNGEAVRFGVRLALLTLLDDLWRRGALVGDSPDAAYGVRCDAITTPEAAAANGQLIAEVGIAPTVPYEFILLRLGLTTDELQISEV